MVVKFVIWKVVDIPGEYETEFYQEYTQYSSSKQISSSFHKLLDVLNSTESKLLLDDVPSAIDVSQVCFETLWIIFTYRIYILYKARESPSAQYIHIIVVTVLTRYSNTIVRWVYST